MAAVIAWAQANMALIVGAIATAVIAWMNRDKIKAHLPAALGGDKAAEPDDGSFSFDKVAAKIREFLESLGDKGDAVKRSIHLGMLVVIEDDIAVLPDGPEKAEQLAAIQTLAKYRVVSSPSKPAVAS